MNKSQTTTWVVAGIAVLLIAGAAAYYVPKANTTDTTATSTPVVTTPSPTPSEPVTTSGSAPAAITSSDVTTSEMAASLSGSVKPNGFYTSYWFEYGTTADLGSRSAVQNIGSGFISMNAPGYVQNLAKNTTYYFRLVAQNEAGKALGTVYTFKTMPGNPPVGSLPTIKTVSATKITGNTATIAGDVTPNKASTNYWFEYGKTKDFGAVTPVQSVGDGQAKVTVTLPLSGLDTGTTYYYRVNAQNQFGTVNGLTMTFKTTGVAKGAPTLKTLDATSLATSTATLRGTVNANGLDTTYWFEYSTDSLLGSVLLSTTNHTSAGGGITNVSVQAPIKGLTTKTNYYYRIVAQNSMGITVGDKVTFKTK